MSIVTTRMLVLLVVSFPIRRASIKRKSVVSTPCHAQAAATTTATTTTVVPRSIPLPPQSFYHAVLEASAKSGLRLQGILAPRGLGGSPGNTTSSSAMNYAKDQKWKGLTGGPDVTIRSSSDGPTTIEEAIQVMGGASSPLINRARLVSQETLMEQAFMEASVESSLSTRTQPSEFPHSMWPFVRNPIPWMKKVLGYGDEADDEGFRDIPYYYRPGPGMDRKFASPSFYHGDETLDFRRRIRIQYQALEEARESLLSTASHKLPLHVAMNDIDGTKGSTSCVLRQTAANALLVTNDDTDADTREAPMDQKQSTAAWARSSSAYGDEIPLGGSSVPQTERLDQKHGRQDEAQIDLPQWRSLATIVLGALGLSAAVALLQGRYDFIGDLKPSVE